MRQVALVVVAAFAAAAATPGSAGVPARPAFAWTAAQKDLVVNTSFVARPSRCAVRRGPASYPWPVEPFRRQHPIRAFFGDPRTIFRNGSDAGAGAFSFHNGVDIVADDGTAVYPVLSGTVTKIGPDEISVSSADGARIFQYWHLSPQVHLHAHVRAEKTVLGAVQAGRGHVHLSEIEDGVVENPLQPGHLTPYRDTTAPSVEALYIRDPSGRALSPGSLTGPVELAAAATDAPPLPLPPPWSGVPVTPARISWQLSTPSGNDVLIDQTSADFTLTTPMPEEFWRVFDKGTYQNFPTVGRRYFYGTPGDYLFNLTPTPLDTQLLPAGRYTLTVAATDTCGNRGTLSEQIRILPQAGTTPLTGVTLQVLATPGSPPPVRWPRRFWTVVLATLPDSKRTLPAQSLAGPVGLLSNTKTHLLIGGVFHNGPDAYVAARAATSRFADAYPREIIRRAQMRRDWPRQTKHGRYTVVLASLPARAGGATAAGLERAAARQGLPALQLFRSAHFTTLRPGYIVVASGRYATNAAAAEAARLDAAFYGNAYVRELIARKRASRDFGYRQGLRFGGIP